MNSKAFRKTAVRFEFPAEVPTVDGPKKITLAVEVMPDGKILLRDKEAPRGVSLQTSAADVFLHVYGRRFQSLVIL
jgi:hypothetical protein